MRSFSNDLSPIVVHPPMQNFKNRGRECLAEQITRKLEADVSSGSHFSEIAAVGREMQEQRISTAAKTLTYLFSPDIDLLENLEHSLDNYDKYQKARLILRELLAAAAPAPIHQEVMRTSEQIARLEWEIEQLSVAFQQLQAENREKEQKIGKYRKSIMDLLRAYEEAKVCFTDEILEQKYEIEELKRMVDSPANNQKPASKSKNKKMVLLDLPDRQRRKESEAYTDRSIYKRFTVSHPHEDGHNQKSLPEEHNQSHPGNHVTYTHHYHVIETYEFEKEKMQRRMNQQEQTIAKLEEEISTLKKETAEEILQLSNKANSLEAELKNKCNKIKEKNKIITDLLDSAQAKNKR